MEDRPKTTANVVQVKRLLSLASKYRYVLLVVVVGLILLLWPSQGTADTEKAVSSSVSSGFDLDEIERKMEDTLSRVKGAGTVKVVLTAKSGTRQVLAQDVEEAEDGSSSETKKSTVVLSLGSSTEGTVLLQEIYPSFQGALVVYTGGGDATTKLKLLEAVSALTGLSSDKIAICEGK